MKKKGNRWIGTARDVKRKVKIEHYVAGARKFQIDYSVSGVGLVFCIVARTADVTIQGGEPVEFMTDARGGGYQREQVDAYVSQLRQTYQQLYEAHAALQKQYDQLRVGAPQRDYERDACVYRAQKEAIAQALIQAQYAANAMLTAAREEAEQIRRGLSPGIASRTPYAPQALPPQTVPYPGYYDYSQR